MSYHQLEACSITCILGKEKGAVEGGGNELD